MPAKPMSSERVQGYVEARGDFGVAELLRAVERRVPGELEGRSAEDGLLVEHRHVQRLDRRLDLLENAVVVARAVSGLAGLPNPGVHKDVADHADCDLRLLVQRGVRGRVVGAVKDRLFGRSLPRRGLARGAAGKK